MTNPPGSTVLVNGKTRGMTDNTGVMSVLGLKPGRYMLTIQKPNHRDEQRTVELTADKSNETFFCTPGRMLTSRRNYRSDHSSQQHSKNVPRPHRKYVNCDKQIQITVSKPGYRAITREVLSMGQP